MASKAKRNVAQLLKDNRYSNVPILCSRRKCENPALLIKGPTEARVKICEEHYAEINKPKSKPYDALIASLGLA